VARDHEYVWHGTLSLLAGIDPLTGEVHASVEEWRRWREFVAFLQKLDAAYPPATAIKLILDNHSAHVSKETKAWLAAQPRFVDEAARVPAVGERPLGLGREPGVAERGPREVLGAPFTATRSTAGGRFSPAELDSWRA
jgi:DDE superfamily endonuclease